MRRLSLMIVLAAGALALLPSSAFAVAGNFFQPVTSPESAGDASRGIVSADFDDDGNADLAIGNTEDTNTITLLKGDGSGDFTAFASSPLSAGSAGAWHLEAADVDNDNDEDLISVGSGPNPGPVGIFLNNGSGVFAAPLIETAGSSPRIVRAADINGDTYIDLVVGNFYTPTVTVLINDGDTDMVPDGIGNGTFTATAGSPITITGGGSTNLTALAVGLIDNNGTTDIVVGREFSNDIQVLTNNGSGIFTLKTPQTFASLNPGDIAVGEFNGAANDLAVANGDTNSVSILNGVGDGTFTEMVGSPISIGTTPGSPTANALVAEQLDGDANLDLAVAIGFNTLGSRLAILIGNGAGGFSNAPTSPELAPSAAIGPNVPLGITAAQFNGGGLDLANSNLFPQPSTPVNILLNDSTLAVPPAPSVNGTTPGSGANENSPRVFGSAEIPSTVSLYANATCTPPAAVSGPATTFASPGLLVSVADDSTTTFSATTHNGEGPSSCSTVNATYQEVTTPPAGGGGTTTPPATAPVKKKCKKGQKLVKGKCKKKKKKKKRK